ncbi:ceramide phosphoethanolamine synthase-like [Ylistrum balloti]|uniref:ceramide phosphoethanolamine synthase-like n=1 Tax=Ylistrum balloti TaxID=509963 RepID=UPI002905CEA0|nr:ceramide phosphoethanolamine synthase-like [Ylistrum balloti]
MTSDSSLRMLSHLLQTCRTERSLLLMTSLLLLMYFFIMDIVLYMTLQSTKLVDQEKTSTYSPFHPLSVKLLMTAPTNHYVISLTTEYFDEYTQLSKIFYFITPNMISATHLALGFLSGKFVASESLRRRRIGVLIFELRLWLDVYDGVVYRSHKGFHGYRSNRRNLGFVVDTVCDTTSGIALCFGVLFFLWKFQVQKNQTTSLPFTKSSENGTALSTDVEKPYQQKYPRNHIFYKVLCFGLMLALTGMTFDKTTEAFGRLFNTKMETSLEEDQQTEALHTLTTWVVFYCWRLIEAQAMLQYLLLAIFLDKTWEFICFIQYSGYGMLFLVNVMSQLQIRNVRHLLRMASTDYV